MVEEEVVTGEDESGEEEEEEGGDEGEEGKVAVAVAVVVLVEESFWGLSSEIPELLAAGVMVAVVGLAGITSRGTMAAPTPREKESDSCSEVGSPALTRTSTVREMSSPGEPATREGGRTTWTFIQKGGEMTGCVWRRRRGGEGEKERGKSGFGWEKVNGFGGHPGFREKKKNN